MKGTAIVIGASLIAGLIASTEFPTATSPTKPEAGTATELQSYFDSLASDNKLSGVLLVASGFYEPGKEIPNLAIGYSRMSPDGQRSEESRDNTSTREVKGGPAGGGFSTAPDLVKFQEALFSYKLLDKAHTDLVTTGKVDGPRGMGRYGYGFGDNNADGKHSVGHNGGAPGIAANLEMFPDSGYTAVALMNTDPPALMPIAKGIRDRIPSR